MSTAALALMAAAPAEPRLVVLDRTPRSEFDVMEFPDGHCRITQKVTGGGSTTLNLTPERREQLRAYLNGEQR